jgi:hypothetical protein
MPEKGQIYLMGSTFSYNDMTIYFSGDEYGGNHLRLIDGVIKNSGSSNIVEGIHIDALDATKGSTVPLEVWVKAHSPVESVTMTYQYDQIDPCPTKEEERMFIRHDCQACSSLVNACSQGQYPVCDGSSEFICRDV